MRVLFLGSPEFAVPSLKALMKSPQYDLVAVITQPDRKAGRGQKLTPPPVKTVATASEIPVFQFPRIRNNAEVQELLADLQPELMVVVAFGQILPPDFFEFSAHGTLNVHASLLPKYRGAAPVAHAILNGERETGITIMRIDEGMDTGDVLSQKRIPIPDGLTTGELESCLAEEGAALLLDTLGGYVQGTVRPVSQNPLEVSYAPLISKKDGRINWEESAIAIHNRVRAMNPWPVASSLFRNQPVKIWRSTVFESSGEIEVGAKEGTVVALKKDRVVVQCGSSTYLGLATLQLPNRRRVSAGDFVNGNQLCVGEHFS